MNLLKILKIIASPDDFTKFIEKGNERLKQEAIVSSGKSGHLIKSNKTGIFPCQPSFSLFSVFFNSLNGKLLSFDYTY
jgi:hypothetical protein